MEFAPPKKRRTLVAECFDVQAMANQWQTSTIPECKTLLELMLAVAQTAGQTNPRTALRELFKRTTKSSLTKAIAVIDETHNQNTRLAKISTLLLGHIMSNVAIRKAEIEAAESSCEQFWGLCCVDVSSKFPDAGNFFPTPTRQVPRCGELFPHSHLPSSPMRGTFSPLPPAKFPDAGNLESPQKSHGFLSKFPDAGNFFPTPTRQVPRCGELFPHSHPPSSPMRGTLSPLPPARFPAEGNLQLASMKGFSRRKSSKTTARSGTGKA